MHEDLNVPQQNFEIYFTKYVYLKLIFLIWIVQNFTDEKFDLSYFNVLSCGQT